MKTVLCHGVFDVIHAGHLAYFEEAKKYGDKLIVSITADRFVNKGPGRPYFSTEKRRRIIEQLRIVDEVIVSDEATALGSITRTRPDFYVKGPDYKDLAGDVTGEILNEKAAVESFGGKLVFTDTPMHSSSTLINKFFHNWTDEQKAQIEKINSIGGFDACQRALDNLERLKVLVLGEPILDVYRFVSPEGISSKSPTVSCRFQSEETYFGGSTAIYNHLKDFCQVELLKPITCSRVYPSKIRYIDQGKSQRIFEVTEIYESEWDREDYTQKLSKTQADVFVVADFGHGLFEDSVLKELSSLDGFLGLNVQTNSSNFGFNVYTKHKNFDYLCLDTREVRLSEHDRYSNPLEIAHRVHKKIKVPASITLGSNGSILLEKGIEFKSPAFTDVVIDATGAGDAYFAITTLLMASGCHQALVPFIGNVFAGLKTKIIGNKMNVSKASLLKAIRAILA